jgi:PAS domain S-box-containing protein
MPTLPEPNQPSGSELPIFDRLMLYGICPVLLLVSLFLLGKSVFMTQAVAQGADSPISSMWLLIICGTLLMACVGISAWRMATFSSERTSKVREAGLQRRTRHFEDMLRMIVDNIPNVVFIADREGRIWFANRETVPNGKEAEEIVGKTLDRIFPVRIAHPMMERIRRAQKGQVPVITLDRRDDAGGITQYLETYHIPLPNTSDLHDTVLVTQKDITATIVERERMEQTLTQIVDALVAVIDRRDPFAAGHSLRVGMVSSNLARYLDLDDGTVEACRIAGALMNLGKIMVPRRILMKSTALDIEELKLVRKSILASADILSLISFQTPVIPTLRQVLERYDGKGVPEGRRGENIMISARIIAVANAFIALVSPRAHRGGLSVDEAMGILNKDNGAAFDPKLVKALADHLRDDPGMCEALMKPTPEVRGVIPDEVPV